MTVSLVSCDGVAIAVDDLAAGDRPVLVLHGFTGSAAAMAPLTERLALHHRVLAPDLVGHGRSDAPADVEAYRAAAMVAQLAEVLRAAGVERVDVVGYSMGARVALTLACARPEIVRRMVVVGGTAGIDDEHERAERRAADGALADRIEREGIEAFVDAWEAIPLFASQRALPAEALKAIRAGRLSQRPLGLANSLRGFGAGEMPPLWGDLADLPVPTLAVAGELDAKYTALAERLANEMPVAKAVTIAGVGHAAHLEAPAAVGRLLTDFLGP